LVIAVVYHTNRLLFSEESQTISFHSQASYSQQVRNNLKTSFLYRVTICSSPDIPTNNKQLKLFIMKQLSITNSVLVTAIAFLFTACKKENQAVPVANSITTGIPSNNAVISLGEAKQSVNFKWSVGPTSPMVTYRLRVWQLMQGQNSSAAMKENTPIVDKSTDANTISISGMLTGPCKPPYLCEFVWNVAIIERDANGTVKEIIVSGTGNFSVN
jgi:hypothetical protein